MKQLITHVGGHPISRNDLRHIQESYTETIKGLSAVLGNRFYAFGAVVNQSGINYTYTAGGIFTNDEYFEVDAQTTPLIFATAPDWGIVETWGVSNPVNYRTGGAKNVHKIRKIALVAQGTGIAPWNSSTWRRYNGGNLMTEIDAIKSLNTTQDSRLTAIEAVNGSQATDIANAQSTATNGVILANTAQSTANTANTRAIALEQVFAKSQLTAYGYSSSGLNGADVSSLFITVFSNKICLISGTVITGIAISTAWQEVAQLSTSVASKIFPRDDSENIIGTIQNGPEYNSAIVKIETATGRLSVKDTINLGAFQFSIPPTIYISV